MTVHAQALKLEKARTKADEAYQAWQAAVKVAERARVVYVAAMRAEAGAFIEVAHLPGRIKR